MCGRDSSHESEELVFRGFSTRDQGPWMERAVCAWPLPQRDEAFSSYNNPINLNLWELRSCVVLLRTCVR